MTILQFVFCTSWLSIVLFVLIIGDYLKAPRWYIQWKQFKEIDHDVLEQPQIQQLLLRGRKLKAIKLYQQLTEKDFQESTIAIEYAIKQDTFKKGKIPQPLSDVSDAGIRDLIAEGKKEMAVDIYWQFTGVDQFSARDVVKKIQRNMRWKHGALTLASDISDAGIRDLIEEGEIDEAVRIYQQFAGVDQFTAQDAVEQIQREMHLNDPSDMGSNFDSWLDSSNENLSRRS